MEVLQVSEQDGKKCAQLINLLKAGKWELSGPDITAHSETVRWVHDLALKMAKQLNPQGNSTNSGIKVKAAGPLPAAPKMSSTGPSKVSKKKNNKK